MNTPLTWIEHSPEYITAETSAFDPKGQYSINNVNGSVSWAYIDNPSNCTAYTKVKDLEEAKFRCIEHYIRKSTSNPNASNLTWETYGGFSSLVAKTPLGSITILSEFQGRNTLKSKISRDLRRDNNVRKP